MIERYKHHGDKHSESPLDLREWISEKGNLSKWYLYWKGNECWMWLIWIKWTGPKYYWALKRQFQKKSREIVSNCAFPGQSCEK